MYSLFPIYGWYSGLNFNQLSLWWVFMFLLSAVNTLEISENEMSRMAMDWGHTPVLAMPLLTAFREGTK